MCQLVPHDGESEAVFKECHEGKRCLAIISATTEAQEALVSLVAATRPASLGAPSEGFLQSKIVREQSLCRLLGSLNRVLKMVRSDEPLAPGKFFDLDELQLLQESRNTAEHYFDDFPKPPRSLARLTATAANELPEDWRGLVATNSALWWYGIDLERVMDWVYKVKSEKVKEFREHAPGLGMELDLEPDPLLGLSIRSDLSRMAQ